MLSKVVSAIRLHFLIMQRKRIQEAIDWKKWMEEYERQQRKWKVVGQGKRGSNSKEKEQAHARNAIQTALRWQHANRTT